MVTIESTQLPCHANSHMNALPKNRTSRPWGTHKGCPNVTRFLLRQRASSHQPGRLNIKNHDDHHHGGHYWPYPPNYWEIDPPLQPQLNQYQNTRSAPPQVPHHHLFLSNSCCRHTTRNKNISTKSLCFIKYGSHPWRYTPYPLTPQLQNTRRAGARIFVCIRWVFLLLEQYYH